MTKFRGERNAFGWPGIEPRWTHGSKEGVGTAHSHASHVWFTLCHGALTEVYYPTVDRPQLRDLQFLVTDGRSFYHEERRHMRIAMEPLARHVLGYHVTSSDPDGRYTITKEVIADPLLPVVLQNTRLEATVPVCLYVACAPRLNSAGWSNNGYVVEVQGREILVAEKDGIWLAVAATTPFARLSVGFAGTSDGRTDLHDNFRMDWEFDRALEGNILLTGELDLAASKEFTLGLAFGHSMQSAIIALFQSLAMPFADVRRNFVNQWEWRHRRLLPLERYTTDGGELYHASHSLLLAHEDKTYRGAFIASLSIPWGEAVSDDGIGGYHLVWTRDMVNTAMGLLAAGDLDAPLRALIYLASSQQSDGGFPQNFWINGEPHWHGIQLDEVAFPILLAWRLKQEGALRGFDPYTMVLRAAGYLITHGPATQQERWEENAGYSPATLAATIAALICAASLVRDRGDQMTANFLEGYADFLEGHVEAWTVTTQGILVPGIRRHLIRIHPVDVTDVCPNEDPNQGSLTIANTPPGKPHSFPAKSIVDAGFLELVRYGIRHADDPLIRDSLVVVDATLRVQTPYGPVWRRYNHDGYGQQSDGSPYSGYGKGRSWPLLTGERGHYELAAGRDVSVYIGALERFASRTGLLPEQVWDEAGRPESGLSFGGPTGAATPLMWAHAEYIKLLRSVRDGRVFDLIEPVRARYLESRRALQALEIWKPNRRTRTMRAGATLRIQCPVPFRLRWSADGWQTLHDIGASATAAGVFFADIRPGREQRLPIRFTFFWTAIGKWEGQDYEVAVTDVGQADVEDLIWEGPGF